MNDLLSKFVSENEKLFKQKDLSLIYKEACNDYEMMTNVWQLTNMFYELGIDPLNYGTKLDTIPDYYLAYSDIIPKEIPEGILYIGRASFAATGGFRNITLPNSLKEIGFQSFSHCNLEEIIIPENVTYIDSQAFQGCSLLKKVTILSPKLKFGNEVFYRCPSLQVIESKDHLINGLTPSGVKIRHI